MIKKILSALLTLLFVVCLSPANSEERQESRKIQLIRTRLAALENRILDYQIHTAYRNDP